MGGRGRPSVNRTLLPLGRALVFAADSSTRAVTVPPGEQLSAHPLKVGGVRTPCPL